MCGLAGILNLQSGAPVRTPELAAMLDPLASRGPDGRGTYLEEPEQLGLAHARLSIIDLAGGAQPIHNEDRTIWVVFNGEIFNYVELRAAASTRTPTPKSSCTSTRRTASSSSSA